MHLASRWHKYSNTSAFSPYKSTFPLWNNTSAQVSLSFLVWWKYFIAWNLPSLRCHFCLVNITSVFFSYNFCLFPMSVASTWASTLGCMLQEVAFSLASAQTRGSCTVWKCLCCCIPHWCRRSTQSSILSPIPPGRFFICHWTCLSIAWTFGVMEHCSILLPCTATNINVW